MMYVQKLKYDFAYIENYSTNSRFSCHDPDCRGNVPGAGALDSSILKPQVSLNFLFEKTVTRNSFFHIQPHLWSQCRQMLSILKQKQFSKLILLMTWFSSLQLAGQVMICSDAVNLYSVERNAIVAGVADRYLSSRFDHEWRQSLSDGSPGLITSVAGDKLLRQERLKWYPEIRVRAALNGGDLRTEGATVDAAPIVTTAAHYRLPFLTRLGLVTWMRFENIRW